MHLICQEAAHTHEHPPAVVYQLNALNTSRQLGKHTYDQSCHNLTHGIAAKRLPCRLGGGCAAVCRLSCCGTMVGASAAAAAAPCQPPPAQRPSDPAAARLAHPAGAAAGRAARCIAIWRHLPSSECISCICPCMHARGIAKVPPCGIATVPACYNVQRLQPWQRLHQHGLSRDLGNNARVLLYVVSSHTLQHTH